MAAWETVLTGSVIRYWSGWIEVTDGVCSHCRATFAGFDARGYRRVDAGCRTGHALSGWKRRRNFHAGASAPERCCETCGCRERRSIIT